ncbi:MAG: hypothetical protein BroJett011_07310 [Chloroflexota bacterium]|nr:MAG: hypothetical protein BroJett011_07310 [Chloroflexota bacterium]
MSHLIVEFYERFGDKFPCCTVDDHDVRHRQYFHDLHHSGLADRAARVVVRPGDEYRTGDHIRLLDRVQPGYADTVAIDPAIAGDVDLDEVLFNEHGFAERAEAVLIVTNPNADSSYRLRVNFFAQLGQKIPTLLLYDWECPQGGHLADLDCFHFAHKVASLRVEKGPAYREGDRVVLREALTTGSRSYALEPGDYDLTRFMVEEGGEAAPPLIHVRKSWAETIAAIELEFEPRVIWH